MKSFDAFNLMKYRNDPKTNPIQKSTKKKKRMKNAREIPFRCFKDGCTDNNKKQTVVFIEIDKWFNKEHELNNPRECPNCGNMTLYRMKAITKRRNTSIFV